MKKIVALLLFVFALAVVAGAQKKMKPWTEWNEKDAQKILNDSAWGQTQTETSTSELFYSPANRGAGADTGQASGGAIGEGQGALNQATSINYRIRFLSAKPIRQAFARLIGSKQPELKEQLNQFVERDFSEWIVVSVVFESGDQRFTGPAMQAFNSAITSTLKNNTYLELKGGKRLFLEDYKAPASDGLGAKFIFKRAVDGEPFIKPDSGEVRFYSEVAKNIKLNMRFKVSDMMYDGKLEY
jgi:hypothetical protein